MLGTFQPTFLYESLWCLLLALVLVRGSTGAAALRQGQLFALYVVGYPLGRIVFELLRSDEANHILGLRVNVWTSMLVFVLGVVLFVGRAAPRGSRPRARSSISPYGIDRLTC